jgi:hypothetical protein
MVLALAPSMVPRFLFAAGKIGSARAYANSSVRNGGGVTLIACIQQGTYLPKMTCSARAMKPEVNTATDQIRIPSYHPRTIIMDRRLVDTMRIMLSSLLLLSVCLGLGMGRMGIRWLAVQS